MANHESTASLDDSRSAPARSLVPHGLVLVLRSDQPLLPSCSFSFEGAEEVLIGRGEAQRAELSQGLLRIQIPDRHMSSRHVRVLRLPHAQWVVEDAGSKNGTVVNGEPCTRQLLAEGDVVEIGASLFHFGEVCPSGQPVELLPGLSTLSPQLAQIYAQLALIARSNLSLLLIAETGAGKEMVTRAVHKLSGRTGELVAMNSGAVPETLLESTLFGFRRGAFSGAVESRPGVVRSADQGTLFLDEVGELPLPAQVALLRVLQEREVVPVGETRPLPVDVRVVAATHRDLRARVESGQFREDLYARLAGVVVEIPPLRARRVDLGLLVADLLRRIAPDLPDVRFSPRAARALLRYDWPRNVRELEASLAQAITLAAGPCIELEHLPAELREPWTDSPRPPARSGEAPPVDPDITAPRLAELFVAHAGNISAVARELQTSRSQVHRLVRRALEQAGPAPSAEAGDPFATLRRAVARTAPDYRSPGADPELHRAELEELLQRCGGNVTAVAREVGKDPKQIRRWLQKLGLVAEPFRKP